MTIGSTLHASCVVVGEAGVLIRGPSGSGKSALAHDLILEAERRGRFARLVGDDRVGLANRNGRLVATAVPAIAGQLEARGFGVLTLPYESSAVVRLVVDCLAEAGPRFPGPEDGTLTVEGVRVPRIGALSQAGAARIILLRLDNPGDAMMTDR
jgi:serine kinase of HPr protein (carbohydrate metabolism regulator)